MKQYTPMMQQYLEIKKKYPDCLVMYRLGDFYELFFEDAKTVSYELDLVLTGRNAGVEEKVPMCGVPYHAVSSYLQRLINRGYKVAMVEQLEDPSIAKGIVKRDVVRVITPGTILDDNDTSEIKIAAITDYNYNLAIAVIEMATGETVVKKIENDVLALKQQLLTDGVKELVVASDFDAEKIVEIQNIGVVVSYCDVTSIAENYLPLCRQITHHYFLLSYGRLLNYLMDTQKRMMNHLKLVSEDNDHEYLQMDYATLTNLELIIPTRQQGKSKTLYKFLNRTQTAMGSRLLKKWIEKPLLKLTEIQRRQNAITYFLEEFLIKEKLIRLLGSSFDLDRLVAKVAYGNCHAQDLKRIEKTLTVVPEILTLIQEVPGYKELSEIDACGDLKVLIEASIVDEPPALVRDGGMIKDGYDPELDRLRLLQKGGEEFIFALEAKQRELTGIKNLKVGYNRVFGYYYEVSKGNLHLVKEEYGFTRKQTLTNAERFVSEELQAKEEEIINASVQGLQRESILFEEIIQEVRFYLPQLQVLSNALATIDSLISLTIVSGQTNYCLPRFNADGLVDVKAGRHPILETILKDNRFIENDWSFDEATVMLITGPNMGGKSTFMRQCALIVIMAQMGLYVPASSCELPIFDKLFTRMGASDDILSGQSTFMVEMNEANYALKNATANSLILFDEIGRGTSTFDGMSLAQAIIEYVGSILKAKTLFSTHYHELTSLEKPGSPLKNYHIEVFEEAGNLTFLYRVNRGKASKSYGLNVARLAGLPESILKRAALILKEMDIPLEREGSQVVEVERVPLNYERVIKLLKKVEADNLTPINALQLVYDLKKELDDE